MVWNIDHFVEMSTTFSPHPQKKIKEHGLPAGSPAESIQFPSFYRMLKNQLQNIQIHNKPRGT